MLEKKFTFLLFVFSLTASEFCLLTLHIYLEKILFKKTFIYSKKK